MHIPTANIHWTPSFRIIANCYPPINFFERITADPDEWEILLEIERMTDPSIHVGDLGMLERDDRIAGPGAGRILPSFTFLDPGSGARFSNYQFGAYYCAFDIDTAIFETVHHREVFMKRTHEPAQDLDQLLLLADLNGELHDIRTMQAKLPDVYDAGSYVASQRLAASVRADGGMGIVYDSMRRSGGESAAVLRARVLSNAREDRHITYRWNGTRIIGLFDKGNFHRL